MAKPHASVVFAVGAWLIAAAVNPTAWGVIKGPPQAVLELAEGSQSTPLELRWIDGWMLARVKINGVDAGWFKIATGWVASCIDRRVAARLRLPVISPTGLLPESDSGQGGVRPVWFRANVLECGGARAESVWLGEKDLSDLSAGALESYGEGIAGVIGWDLLRSLPFLLDEGALKLTWQREAIPEAGAVRVVMSGIDVPVVEIIAGDGVKARAVMNTASAALSVADGFVRRHAEKIWRGRVCGSTRIFFTDSIDDDQLPTGQIVKGWPSGRWVPLTWGGHTLAVPGVIDGGGISGGADIQIGYGVLCQWRLLFDGPGSTLWLKPTSTKPEVTLVSAGASPVSPALLTRLLRASIDRNDAEAVRAVARASVLLNGTGPDDQSPLTRAAYAGAREAALALLEAGAEVDPHRGQPAGSTPLMGATVGDPGLVKTLLERGADANRATAMNFLPINSALRFGGVAAVRELRKKAEPPTADADLVECFYNACAGGHLELVKEYWALLGAAVRAHPAWKRNLHASLEQAILLGHEEVVDWLLDVAKADATRPGVELAPLLAAILPTRVEKSDAVRQRLVVRLLASKADANAGRQGISPLLLAARHGPAGIVDALLAAGARAEETDFKGRNALHRAAAANQPAELIAPLLKAGLDPEALNPDTDRTALGEYAWRGNASGCAALLKAGAKPDTKGAFGLSALSLAANSSLSRDEEALEVISLLLEHGAKITKSAADLGPLIAAVGGCRDTLLAPLVKAGASVADELQYNLSPLGMAAAVSNRATVERLLELGADIRAVDSYGVGVLGHAAAAGRVDIMALLLSKGASRDASSPSEKPPLWVAANTGQLASARLLLAAGSDPAGRDPKSMTTALEAAQRRNDATMQSLIENVAGGK